MSEFYWQPPLTLFDDQTKFTIKQFDYQTKWQIYEVGTTTRS